MEDLLLKILTELFVGLLIISTSVSISLSLIGIAEQFSEYTSREEQADIMKNVLRYYIPLAVASALTLRYMQTIGMF